MQNGFIYDLADQVVGSLNYLNIVKFFKFLAKRLTREDATKVELISNINVSIDIFIVLKWCLILFLWFTNTVGSFWTLLVFYLIWSNLHTYFYYHLWKKEKNRGLEKMRRRFVNLLLAVVYSNFSFAYLYSKVFQENFLWSFGNDNQNLQALLYSFLQSVFVGSESIIPKTLVAETLVVTQVLVSFVFLVVILSTSIPTQNESNL
jgi:O-antigen ligase